MCFKKVFTSFVLLASLAQAQNYPDISWKTTTTQHFVIHYYDDVAWTAQKVAVVAEEAYEKITSYFNFVPKQRTHIVIRDDEDTSNGYAAFQINFINLWISPSSLSLRGRDDWIRTVVAHELSHLVSLQASSPLGMRVEGLRVGGASNGDTKWNVDIGETAYFPFHPYARWWTEGYAQLGALKSGYDPWDSNRNMLLRSAILENNLLSFEEMRNISVREHFGGELVYNQAFSFLLWLKKKYGPSSVLSMLRESQKTWAYDFDRMISKALQKNSRELYEEWKNDITLTFQEEVKDIQPNPIEGTRIPLVSEKTLSQKLPKDRPYADGLFNSFLRFSPDGHWLSWIQDGRLKLRFLNVPFQILPPQESKEEKEKGQTPIGLTLEFSARYYSWAPDSQQIVLSKRKPNIIRGYPYYDLFRLDLSSLRKIRDEYVNQFQKTSHPSERKKSTRNYEWKIQGIDLEPVQITHQARATHPSWSPDGRWIAFSSNHDGRRSLKIMNSEGTQIETLVDAGGDSEATDPSWAPDSQTLAFTLFHHRQADIWMVDRKGKNPKPVFSDSYDDREPVFGPDGKFLYFSSNRTGIFQIYQASLGPSLSLVPLTRLTTGAFGPYVASNQLLYLRFSSFGFKPYLLPLPTPSSLEQNTISVSSNSSDSASALQPETFPALSNSKAYFPWPRPLRFFPTLLGENNQIKAGLALQLTDDLEKHELVGTAVFGQEQDYQISYTNRVWYPDFFGQYTAYIRNQNVRFFSDGDNFDDDPDGILRDKIQFITAGLTQDFQFSQNLQGLHQVSLYYHKRFVDRRVGFPTLLNDKPGMGFRLLTNDSFSLDWSWSQTPSQRAADFDINPRNAFSSSLSYTFVHTHLFSPDSTIPSPNQNYLYHEVSLSLAKYFEAPWRSPWWNLHSVWFRFLAGIKSRDVNVNDEFFLGGRINYRAFGEISTSNLFYGYEDFSISGETMLLLSTGYTLPLLRSMNKKWRFLFLDGVYATLFGEIGNAWNFGEFKNLKQNPTRDPTLGQGSILLEDVGVEIKVKAFLFQDSNRWNSILRVAYGFQDDAAHGFSDSDWPVRIYLGLGTSF